MVCRTQKILGIGDAPFPLLLVQHSHSFDTETSRTMEWSRHYWYLFYSKQAPTHHAICFSTIFIFLFFFFILNLSSRPWLWSCLNLSGHWWWICHLFMTTSNVGELMHERYYINLPKGKQDSNVKGGKQDSNVNGGKWDSNVKGGKQNSNV